MYFLSSLLLNFKTVEEFSFEDLEAVIVMESSRYELQLQPLRVPGILTLNKLFFSCEGVSGYVVCFA